MQNPWYLHRCAEHRMISHLANQVNTPLSPSFISISIFRPLMYPQYRIDLLTYIPHTVLYIL
jgi:hypothetical protein